MAQIPQINQMAVATGEELIAATRNKKITEINVSGDLADLSAFEAYAGPNAEFGFRQACCSKLSP